MLSKFVYLVQLNFLQTVVTLLLIIHIENLNNLTICLFITYLDQFECHEDSITLSLSAEYK